MDNTRKNSINAIITGVGGQGNVLAAKLIATTALVDGNQVSVGDVYGLSQRGGSVASHIRWSADQLLPPLVPEGRLDLLLAFEPLEALRIMTQYGSTQTIVVTNNQPVLPIGVQAGRFTYPDIEKVYGLLQKMSRKIWWIQGTTLAKKLGNIQLLNTIMLGALSETGQVPFNDELFEKVIKKIVSEKFVSRNINAFRQGKKTLSQKDSDGN